MIEQINEKEETCVYVYVYVHLLRQSPIQNIK